MDTQPKRIPDLARWLAIPEIGFVLFYAINAFSFFVFLLLSPFPDLFPFFSSFVFAFGFVAAVALLAPKYKRQVVIIALLLTTLYQCYQYFRIGQFSEGPNIVFIIFASMIGGAIPLALSFYFTSNVKKTSLTKIIMAGCVILVLIFAGIFYLNFVDYWAKPDPIPEHSILKNYEISNYHEYRLAGFIDETKLQRFDIVENNLRNMLSAMRLVETQDVPEDFFIYRPHWWPDNLPAHYLAFKSPEFSFDTRPGDGTYYFFLYDVDQQRAFLWVDENF